MVREILVFFKLYAVFYISFNRRVWFTAAIHMSDADLVEGASLLIARKNLTNGNKNTTEKKRRDSRAKRRKKYALWIWYQWS